MKLSLSCSGSDHGTAPPPQAGDSAKTKAIIHAHILTFSIWILDMWATHAITHKYAKKYYPYGVQTCQKTSSYQRFEFDLFCIIYYCLWVSIYISVTIYISMFFLLDLIAI